MQWGIAVSAAVAVGVAGTVYVRGILMRRDETAAGIRTLAAMSWREFIHLVLEAMARRGFARVIDQDAAGDTDYVLARGAERWLLSCKHGSAFVIGKLTVNELANEVGLANASGGLLVTQGRIVDEARAAAAPQRIELLDGPGLWPEVRELLKPGQLDAIRAGAARRARRRVAAVWTLAAAVGAGLLLLQPAPAPVAAGAPAPAAAPAPAPAGPPPSETGADAGSTADTGAGGLDAAAGPARPTVPVSAQEQRQAVADAVAALPFVDRALWTSRSTLEVYLLEAVPDAFDGICPLMERHPDVAASRIQLNPPPASGAQVRFRQCRSY